MWNGTGRFDFASSLKRDPLPQPCLIGDVVNAHFRMTEISPTGVFLTGVFVMALLAKIASAGLHIRAKEMQEMCRPGGADQEMGFICRMSGLAA